MANRYALEILAIIAFAAFCVIFLYTSSSVKGADFAGTDCIATTKISELSGKPDMTIRPLIPQWVPPSKEIEATLFAIQAAIGGMFIGGVFGYWIGQKKKA